VVVVVTAELVVVAVVVVVVVVVVVTVETRRNVVFKALRYKPESHRFKIRWGERISFEVS
jgi:lipopolysaccharide/colanic/teichoic acid biosynthesis glycosyltransferase